MSTILQFRVTSPYAIYECNMLFMFYFLVHETHTSLIFQINAGLLMVYVFYSMVAVEKSGIMSVLLKKTGNMLLHGIL